ncbi:hypothetical protein SKAU_G00377230 [Synaphobranchus kaupii]|uniref:Uncharacterized protein n=1 Tax=Synaphobranchus kaupii TaxID=118154 RepID=A0A9Q1ECY4_SYNKA|nr:hypothetical protein SKAU_G00377230 [Synaphobranchus kaupii]
MPCAVPSRQVLGSRTNRSPADDPRSPEEILAEEPPPCRRTRRSGESSRQKDKQIAVLQACGSTESKKEDVLFSEINGVVPERG